MLPAWKLCSYIACLVKQFSYASKLAAKAWKEHAVVKKIETSHFHFDVVDQVQKGLT